MIEIKMTIDHRTLDKDVLRKTAAYLLSLTGDELVAEHDIKFPTDKSSITGRPGGDVGRGNSSENYQYDSSILNSNEIQGINQGHVIPPPPSMVPAGVVTGPDFVTSEIETVTLPYSGPDIFLGKIENVELPKDGVLLMQPAGPITGSYKGVELDAKGLPWDGRIHARTKTKTADGSWKLMRGANPEEVVKVQEQLKRTMYVKAPPVISPPPVVGSKVEHTEFNDAVEEVSNMPDFFSVMAKITMAVKDGKMQHADVQKIVESLGIESVPLIAQRPDLLPAVSDRIDQFLGA